MVSGMTEQHVATFASPAGTFVADTCEPLRSAAAAGQIELAAYGRGSYPGAPIEPGVLQNLSSVGTWTAAKEQPWGLDWHRNEGIEFTCTTAGALSFSCEDDEYDLTAGDITVTRPWQLHRVGRPHVSASTLTWFIIDVDVRRPNQDWNWPAWLPLARLDLDRLTELLSHTERPVWRANRAVLSAVEALERTLQGRASQPMSRIATAIGGVLIELSDLVEQEAPRLEPYLSSTDRTVRLFMEQLVHRVDEPWTVDEMASACGLGRTRFLHYCKKICNASPLEYLTGLRLERAAALLAETNLLVSEVAVRSGFQSGQYFATAFRRRFDLSPMSYRRQCQSSDMG